MGVLFVPMVILAYLILIGLLALICRALDEGDEMEDQTEAALDLTTCAEPECLLPAEVVRRFVLESTAGPIEHMSTRCVEGHHLTMPVTR